MHAFMTREEPGLSGFAFPFERKQHRRHLSEGLRAILRPGSVNFFDRPQTLDPLLRNSEECFP